MPVCIAGGFCARAAVMSRVSAVSFTASPGGWTARLALSQGAGTSRKSRTRSSACLKRRSGSGAASSSSIWIPMQCPLRTTLVQLPRKGGWKSCGYCQRAFTLGHHFGYRFGRPLKWMRMLIPFGDKGHQPLYQMWLVSKIGNPQPFALQDRKPLLDLVHPRTMYGRKMKHKAWMFDQPSLDLLALMHLYVIKHHLNRQDGLGNSPIQMLQKGNEFHLPFALGSRGIDLPRPGIKTSKQ